MKRRVFLLSVVLLSGLAIWRVASAPIRVDFLTPYFEEMLSRNQEGWQLSVGETVLAWRGWSKPLDLNLRDAQVRDRDGERIVRLPVVSLGLSLSALLQGKVAVSRVEILRAELRIERDETGHVAVRDQTANEGYDVTAAALRIVERLLAPRDPTHPLSFVDLVRVEANRITWADEKRRMELSAAPATFDARRSDTGLHCEVTFQLDPGKGATKRGPRLKVVAEALRKGDEGAATDLPGVQGRKRDFTVTVVARAKRIQAAELPHYWPQGVARSARAWVTANIRSGEVDEAVLQLAFDRQSGEARLNGLDGTLSYSGLTVRYLADWPEAQSVRGNATFDRQGLRFVVASGAVGGLTVGRSTVEISGLASDDERISIHAPVSGPSNAIADLISTHSADLAQLLALDSAARPDEGTVDLKIDFPLRKGLSLADVAIAGRAHLPGLHIRNPYVDGVVATSVDFAMREGGKASVDLDVDLTSAGMAIPAVGWRKKEGEQGRAEISLDLDDLRPTALRDLTVDAGTLRARGSMTFQGEGRKVETLELQDVSLGRTKLSNVTLRNSADGWLRVELGAGEVDVEAIRQTADGAAANGEGERSSRKLALVAPQLRRVSFGKERYLEDVSAHVEHDGNGWRLIDVAGKTPGKTAGQFELKLTPTSGGSGRLAARADDVGALFRILGVTTELRGGRLRATGQTAAGGGAPLQVQVEMRDYEFLRSSLLTKLLTLASGRGFAKFRTDDAIAFDYLGGEVAFADGRASTELIRTHGPALGLTVQGWVDTGAQKMELDGAIVPAYAANRVLGKIPLLGGLLSGDGKEGFWAIRYAMRGNPRDPKMEVHTLTSLTPAFLRDMFGKLERATER